MSLAQYKKKRRFGRTPEPAGRKRKAANAPAFVVQKHAARRLHYDFRLELDGVLKSWAVPKGPNFDPDKKALAVQVEDHPYEYKDFEGRIPEGQYGAGTVEIWDRGTWNPLEDPRRGLRAGKLKFELHGDRLHGQWALVRLNGDGNGQKKNWLLMKLRDEAARKNGAPEAQDSEFPSDAQPQLATWVPHPPEGAEWIHEVKFDGYRLLGMVRDGKVRLITRGRQDWTAKFPRIAAELPRLQVREAIVDGEVVVLDEQGRSQFQLLQRAWQNSRAVDPVLYLFDLLYLDGEDLRDQPLTERKSRLAALLKKARSIQRVKFSEHMAGKGDAVISAACRMGLEGIVSKLADAPYRSGRSRSWLKSKCTHRQEFVVIGYTDPRGSRIDFGALLLGYYKPDGDLVYAGRTGTGFDRDLLKDIKGKLVTHERASPPMSKPPPAKERRGAHWVEPKLVAEVKFAGWTDDGLVRQAVFVGLRPDKPPKEVAREDKPIPASTREEREGHSASNVTQGVRLTHPEKVLFPGEGLTKADLAAYYERVADRMLPYVVDRPLTLYRCPDGLGKQCFMQRHHTVSHPEAIVPVKVRDSTEREPYLMIQDRSGLPALVQISSLEIHTWGSSIRDIERPDQLVFDLDPDESFEWKRVRGAALDLRELLSSLKLHPLLKTTGGKGLHLVVPIEPTVKWPAAKEFCKLIAEEFVRRDPDSFTTNMRKSARKGKLFIDYLRNDRTATAIAPYSVRARKGAPVAMPLDWKDLRSQRGADQFNMKNVADRLKRRDSWEGFDDYRVDLRRVVGLEFQKEKP